MFRAGLAMLLRMSIDELDVIEASSLDEVLHRSVTPADTM